MSLALLTYSSVLGLVPKLSSEKDKRMLEAHLEDSIKLLDACNALKATISDAHHYVTLVCYAARLADVKAMDAGMLIKVKDALSTCVEFLDTGRRHGGIASKTNGCGSLLCTKEDQNPVSTIARSSRSNVFFSQVHAAQVTSVFVLREVAASFAMKPNEFLMGMHVVEGTAWASSMSKLQQDVKEVAGVRKSNNTFVHLQDLDNLYSAVKELHGLVYIILGEKACSYTDREKLSIPFERIMKSAGELQHGLNTLRCQIDELFRNVIAIRMSFLDALFHCKS